MTGDKLGWHRVASHLRTPIQALKEQITYTEFIDWMIYLREESEWRLKLEWYLAQIAAEVRRSVVEHPRKVQTSDFIIQIKTPEQKAMEDKMLKSKAAWAAQLNIKLN